MNYENGKSVMLMTNMTILDFSDNIDDIGHIFITIAMYILCNSGSRREGPTTGPHTDWLISLLTSYFPTYLPFENIVKLWLILPS